MPTRFYDRAALRPGTALEGPAIVNQYDSTTVDPAGHVGARRPLREHRHRDRRVGRGAALRRRHGGGEHERRRLRGRSPARAADAEARRGRPDHPARARRRVPRDRARRWRASSSGCATPRSSASPRTSAPASSTREGRELCESDSTPMHIGSLPWYIRGFLQRLERRDRGRRRDRPQPPVPRRVALARRRGRGADLPRGRAARLRGRHRARARRRRLVPGHQRGRLRRLRRGEDLQRRCAGTGAAS